MAVTLEYQSHPVTVERGGGTLSNFAAQHGIGIYAPIGWGAAWRAALANAGSALATLAVVGDSIGRGYWSSSLASKSFSGLARVALQAGYGNGGSGYKGVYDSTLYVAGMPTADRVTLTGTWSQGASLDGPGGTYMLATAAATATFTVSGTTVRIYYLNILTSGGDFTYNIDGAGAVTVHTNAASSIATVTVTGLANAEHTVVITYVNGAVAISGVTGENTTGVVVNNYAISGTTSAQMVNAAPIYGHPAAWSGGVSYPADLIIYEYGVNDSNSARSVDVYISCVRAYLDQIRPPATGGARKTDLLFMLPHIGQFGSTVYHQYAEQLRGMAEAYGAAFVNMWPRWGNCWNDFNAIGGWWDSGGAPGASGSDLVHPSDVGFQAYYDVLAQIILV